MIAARSKYLLAPLTAFALLSGAAHVTANPSPQDRSEVYRQLALFGDIFEQVRSQYVDAPQDSELMRSAIQGMFKALDPHSSYLTPEQYAEMRTENTGAFGGLGIEVTMEDEAVKVVAPIDDSPASRAGVLANDRIVEIDGQPVRGKSLEQAVNMMRGEIGSDVAIVISREGAAGPIRLTLTRDVVTVATVRTSYERDVPIIRLSYFSEQTFTGLDRAIREVMTTAGDTPPRGIILDLRNNGGGLFDQSGLVTDAFLSRGLVVQTRGRSGEDVSRYSAKPDELDALLAGVPLIVLINGGTASAAEIVAGALQDHRRAVLLGTRSFGKGVVQTVMPLPNGGAIRLTTARYYTPSSRSIQALGITPDVEVLQDVPEELKGRDEVIGEAGLEGHLPGEQGEATAGSSVYVPPDRAADNQLQFALKLILGETQHAAFPPDPNELPKQHATNDHSNP